MYGNINIRLPAAFTLMLVLFQRAEEVPFLHYPQGSESQREEEDVKNKEQRRRAIEGVVDITKLCLMEMNQADLADTLWGGKRLILEGRKYSVLFRFKHF